MKGNEICICLPTPGMTKKEKRISDDTTNHRCQTIKPRRR